MKKIHLLLVLCCAVTFSVLSCASVKAGGAQDAAGRENTSHQALSSSYQVTVECPHFEKAPQLNEMLSSTVFENIKVFNREVFNKDGLFGGAYTEPMVRTLDIKSSSIYEDGRFISFLLYVYQFTGGAHGCTTLVPVTYCKSGKKLLSLEDALQPERRDWLTVLSEEARRQLTAQWKQGLFSSDADWIRSGTAPVMKNFEAFALEEDAVRIFFNHYQVGPYSSGIKEIVVPLALFK